MEKWRYHHMFMCMCLYVYVSFTAEIQKVSLVREDWGFDPKQTGVVVLALTPKTICRLMISQLRKLINNYLGGKKNVSFNFLFNHKCQTLPQYEFLKGEVSLLFFVVCDCQLDIFLVGPKKKAFEAQLIDE